MMIAPRAVVGGIALFMVVTASQRTAEGAEWSAEPSLSVRGVYNSNLILTSAPHSDTWGHWVSPGVKFAGATENLEVSGRAAADFVGYYGGVDQSLTNLYFPLSMKYGTERETFALDGGFTRDNTLMGELRQTGVVLSFTQRNYWNVVPSWTHALTERLSLQAGYQYANATYENGLNLGLVDYTTHAGSAGLLYRVSEKDHLQATASLMNFKAPQASNLRSVIYGGDLSWSHEFTETINASLSGGARMVNSSTTVGPAQLEDTQVVWIGHANLQKRWADATVTIDASRDVYPSGFGLLVRTSRVGIGMTKDLTERLTFSLDSALFFAESVASEATPLASLPLNRYITATPAVQWKMSDWWSLDVNYTYARRDVESFNESAFSHAATISLTYYPPKWSVGR
jgi:hypothetical protein